MAAAAIATVAIANFSIASAAEDHASTRELLAELWPVAFTSTALVLLVMLLLYGSLIELVRELESSRTKAQHHAAHDTLTGLPNRALMEERLEEALGRQA